MKNKMKVLEALYVRAKGNKEEELENNKRGPLINPSIKFSILTDFARLGISVQLIRRFIC